MHTRVFSQRIPDIDTFYKLSGVNRVVSIGDGVVGRFDGSPGALVR